MDKKESIFMGLVGFERPLKDEKKLLLEQENLDSVLKSTSTWSPEWILNLKMCILKMKVQQAKFSEFLKSYISKWENRLRMNWASPKRYIPLKGQPPESRMFWLPPKTQNSNSPLTLVGVHTMCFPLCLLYKWYIKYIFIV